MVKIGAHYRDLRKLL